jgi:hypothetical protein
VGTKNHSILKRQKERVREERRRQKRDRKAQRNADRKVGATTPAGETLDAAIEPSLPEGEAPRASE